MGAGFAAEALLAALLLARFGAGEHGTTVALFATGRLSFLLFLAAYVGGGMVVLFGPAFGTLRRHGREFGLSFAAAHLVHAGLVGWLCWIGAAPSKSVFVFFGAALVCTYLLALLSVRRLQDLLGPTGWRLARAVGMNFVAFAFAFDFLKAPLSGGLKHVVEYGPFALLAVAAPLVYVAGLVPARGRGAISRP
jgi:hypothetical protein